MLVARIALGAASALWAALVYGEAERLAAETRGQAPAFRVAAED